jgi:endoglucanase
VSFSGTDALANTSTISFNSSAADFAADMKVGWNLGNSLDAYDLSGGNETAWNNPAVTLSLIQAVKAQGFNTIRIPVTYMNRIGAAPSYTIQSAWLDRIQDVVDYVIDEGLYAIIDIQADANHDYTYGAWLHI